jgi:hypothetical protein
MKLILAGVVKPAQACPEPAEGRGSMLVQKVVDSRSRE